MLGRRLSWLDAVVKALLRDSTPSSRFEVELEGPARLNSHRGEILTGRLRNLCVSASEMSFERGFW